MHLSKKRTTSVVARQHKGAALIIQAKETHSFTKQPGISQECRFAPYASTCIIFLWSDPIDLKLLHVAVSPMIVTALLC